MLRIADAFELMGSTFLLDMHDVGSTLFFWRKALQIRHNGRYRQSSPPKFEFPRTEVAASLNLFRYSRYPKRGLYYHPVFDAIEINSEEELEAVLPNAELMRQQALLITERILGSAHKVLCFC